VVTTLDQICVVAARRVIDLKAPCYWTSGTLKIIFILLKRDQLKSRSG